MKEDPRAGGQENHTHQPVVAPNGQPEAEGAESRHPAGQQISNNQSSTPQPSTNAPDSSSDPQPSSNSRVHYEPTGPDDSDFAFPGSSAHEDPEFGPCSGNEPLAPAQPSTLNLQPLSNAYHRHTGKIGRYPAELREQINIMIHDGVPYAVIILRLGEQGKGLKHYHLSRWKMRGGYPEWCQLQERKDLARCRDQFALDLLRETDAGKVHEASLQIAASRLCQFLADFDPGSLTEKVHSDPQNYVRLLNVLPKLTASGVMAESHRLDMAERREAITKAKNPPKKGLSDEARRHIEEYLFDPPPHY